MILLTRTLLNNNADTKVIVELLSAHSWLAVVDGTFIEEVLGVGGE
jgi:hypothetical protein